MTTVVAAPAPPHQVANNTTIGGQVVLPPPDWRRGALCTQTDPEAFFPLEGNGRLQDWATARRVCGHCPVWVHCLAHAITHGETYGMWGGYTDKQRAQLATNSPLMKVLRMLSPDQMRQDITARQQRPVEVALVAYGPRNASQRTHTLRVPRDTWDSLSPAGRLDLVGRCADGFAAIAYPGEAVTSAWCIPDPADEAATREEPTP